MDRPARTATVWITGLTAAAWLIAAIPLLCVLAVWAALGGHLYAPETLNLALGHLLYGVLVGSIALFAAAVSEGAATAAIIALAFTIGGAMAGIAGLLMTARMNSGHPTAGLGLEFDAIAAVAVGGTSFERGNGWLLGTLLGVLSSPTLADVEAMVVPRQRRDSGDQIAEVDADKQSGLIADGRRDVALRDQQRTEARIPDEADRNRRPSGRMPRDSARAHRSMCRAATALRPP